ncbi:MAG TPA: hypothetical protein VLJ21_04245 [Candidatus Binatia bacterium]|nr:hypothetical protein [Candidatus Binatia bacterium]
MKKQVQVLLLISILALLLMLAGCSSECKVNADCKKTGHTGACVDKKCVYTPIPGACGNGKCDTDTENECTCEADCGSCSGTVPGSTLLQKTCNKDNTQCLVDVPSSRVKPVSITNSILSQGNTFKVTTTFNQPFNFKKDAFTTKILLDNVANFVSNIRIIGYEVSGTNKDRQNVVLVDKDVNKPIPVKGTSVQDDLHLDLTTGDTEGSVANPQLKVDYEYTLTQGTTSQLKTAQIINPLRGITLQWVKPTTSYGCPSATECDDSNPGTADSCSVETNFFCEHAPIPGACGNFQCDGNENKCTCASDCGPCSGSAGQYMDLSCNTQICVSTIRQGTAPVPKSLFDDRSIGPFHLQNRFSYSIPFDATKDRIKAEFTLYDMLAGVSGVKIESIRALDGTTELGFITVNRGLDAVGQSITVEIPITSVEKPESQHFTSLTVAYAYDQNGATHRASFTKGLEKITYITPGPV